jgi:hypothetical protein
MRKLRICKQGSVEGIPRDRGSRVCGAANRDFSVATLGRHLSPITDSLSTTTIPLSWGDADSERLLAKLNRLNPNQARRLSINKQPHPSQPRWQQAQISDSTNARQRCTLREFDRYIAVDPVET